MGGREEKKADVYSGPLPTGRDKAWAAPLGDPPDGAGDARQRRVSPKENHFDREVIPVPGLAATGVSFPSFLPEADNSIEV